MLKLPDMPANKDRFIKIIDENVHREGIERLMKWVEGTDFFSAPASTKFHGNYDGGLCEHSLNVYDAIVKLNTDYNLGFEMETLTIVSLFHDLCKANYYVVSFRNQKNEQGVWEKVPFWSVDEAMPLGHGEKSCMLLQAFMKIRLDELLAIRWHMSGYDKSVTGGDYSSIGSAQKKTKLVGLLQCADMVASQLCEYTAEEIESSKKQ